MSSRVTDDARKSAVYRAAHAKINLLLRILAREASGYHSIETMFQRIALHDDVHVTLTERDRTLHCDGPALPPSGLGAPEQNLAWRAAELYMNMSGWQSGWHIDVHKRIPVGGGLGGGSADAAAVLQTLESCSPSPVGAERLIDMASVLGSDVPFLLTGASRALAWSHGERMVLLPALPSMAVQLFTFDTGVATGEAYARWSQSQTRPAAANPRAYDIASLDNWNTVADLAVNDFETIVPALHVGVARVLPELRRHVAALRRKGHLAIGLMSGSGATCYVLSEAAPSELAFDVDVHRIVTSTM